MYNNAMTVYSHTYYRIKKLLNNPQSSAKDLAKIISGDRDLSDSLLKTVNSEFYGFPQRINTVTGAIVLLGFDAIRNLLDEQQVFSASPSS